MPPVAGGTFRVRLRHALPRLLVAALRVALWSAALRAALHGPGPAEEDPTEAHEQ